MEEPSFADMLAPIPGLSPVGGDVRAGGAGSELYLAIKDERQAARLAEREALSAGDAEVDPLAAGLSSWRAVASQGSALVAGIAKDLQVAAWLVEAWLRTDGLAGLADGLTLLAELVEGYWDEGLFPVEDEDGIEARVAPLFGLFGRNEPGALVQPIKLLPLTDRGEERVALWTIEAVRSHSARHDDPEVREELLARRERRVAALDQAIAGASADFVRANLDAIARAQSEMDRLMAAVDLRTPFGRFGSQVATPLEAIADLLRQHHQPEAGGLETPPRELPSAAGDGEAVVQQVALTTQHRERDREGALATLLDIAGYFDRTEPQSLVGPGLRDLVRRANLPLDVLLAELLPDREQRAMFLMRAGVQASGTDAGGDGFSTF